MTEERPLRVWIDDRNRIFRLGLCACLEPPRFVVAGESGALTPTPDFARTDILVFELGPAALATALRAAATHPLRLVAVAAAAADDELLREAVESGVTGALLRADATPQALMQCLESVAAGNGSFPTTVLGRLLSPIPAPGRTAPDGLTGRELDVLRLLSRGDTTRQIAANLCYSEKTVKNIVHDVLVRMGCKNRAQAVAVATRRGLI